MQQPGVVPSEESDATREDSLGACAGRLEAQWCELQGAIRTRVQREQFETWFRRAALTRADAEIVRLAVQNTFTRDWLRSHYSGQLEQAVEAVFGGPRELQFEVAPELIIDRGEDPAAEEVVDAPPPRRAPASAPVAPFPVSPGQRAGDSPPGLLWDSDIQLNEQYRFDNFVVGPCNRFAHAAAVGVSEAPGKAYNPLFLHGNVGLGKTHLLQSMCHALLVRATAFKILYLSCETFVNHFISALEDGNLATFRHKYRNVDMLVVDDIHILANKERTQEEFFHTFNTLYNAGKQIVLSSDSPPKEIPTLQERLVSRFKWGLVTEIEQPCYETRMAILKRKSKDRGRELPDDVARLLAEHIDTNIRELEGATTRLIGYSTLSKQQITTDLAREVLRDVFNVVHSQPSLEQVVRVVTSHFNVKLTDLQSRKRHNAIAYPRQVAMFLARKITRHSLQEIGGFFGGRDHSTVLYAVEKIQVLSREDPRIRDLLAELLGQLDYRPR